MRTEKQLLLNEMKEQIQKSDSFVIMSYSSLSANKANEFRREIAKNGGFVEVMKKRVLVKAAEAAGLTLDVAALPGHIGLVFVGKQDPIQIAKLVFKYSEDTNKAVGVVGGRIDGKFYVGEDVEKLSKLPSMDEMRAQFLSVLEAPLSQTLAVMDAVMTSVIYCLDNKTREEGINK